MPTRSATGRSVTMSEDLDAKRQRVIEAAREVVEVWGPSASHVMTGLTAALLALEGKPYQEENGG